MKCETGGGDKCNREASYWACITLVGEKALCHTHAGALLIQDNADRHNSLVKWIEPITDRGDTE